MGSVELLEGGVLAMNNVILTKLTLSIKVGVNRVFRRRLTKTHTWVTVRTRVTPSFRVRVCFRAILLCLILKRVLVAY